MYAGAVPRIASGAPRASRASTAPAVAALFVDEHEHDRDMQRVVIPSSEVHFVVRFGPSARSGLDLHALGGRQKVHRKLLRGGQRTVMARIHLGATEAVLGVPASAIAGRIVPLEDLWGDATTRRLFDRFAAARDTFEAATILESAIVERFAIAGGRGSRTQLVLDAADRPPPLATTIKRISSPNSAPSQA